MEPVYFAEGNEPRRNDPEWKILHKILGAIRDSGGGGGGTVGGTGTANRIPLWTAASTQGDSYLLQDANGVLLDTGKDFTVQGTGQLIVPDGSAAAPSITRGGGATGLLFSGDSVLVAVAGVAGLHVTSDGNLLPSTKAGSLGLSGSTTAGNIWTGLYLTSAAQVGWNNDLFLVRDAANTLAQRNGTSKQQFRLYETFTDAANYSRLEIDGAALSATEFQIVTRAAGTGTSRALTLGTLGASAIRFATNSSYRWDINSSGHFLAGAHNTYDIGAAGATSPRTGYFGTSLFVGASSNSFVEVQASNGSSPQFRLANAAGTDHWLMYETTGGAGQQGTLFFHDAVATQDRLSIATTGHVSALRSLSVGGSTDPGDNNSQFDGFIQQTEQSAPSTPSSGFGRWYVSTLGKPRFINDAGTDSDLTATGTAQTVLFAKTAQTSISTATTASIVGTGSGSATLIANFLTVGKSIRIVGRGNLSNQATPGNGTLNLKVGGSSVSSTGAQSLVANANIPYWFSALITCRATGASGTIVANIMFSHGATATAYETWSGGCTTSTVDTTGALAIDVEWTFDTGSNTLLSEILIIEEMALQ